MFDVSPAIQLCVKCCTFFFFFFLFFPLLCVSFFLSHTATFASASSLFPHFHANFFYNVVARSPLCVGAKNLQAGKIPEMKTLSSLKLFYFTSPARTPVYLLIL